MLASLDQLPIFCPCPYFNHFEKLEITQENVLTVRRTMLF